jgi:hypothetical protein
MTAGKKLSFGIKTTQQRTTYEDMLRVWLEADSIPQTWRKSAAGYTTMPRLA